MNHRFLFLLVFSVLLPLLLQGQQCAFLLEGYVNDENTQEALGFATLFVEETKAAAVADERGFFRFESGFCAGSYHLLVRHVGCEPQRIYLAVSSDTSLVIRLHHHTELMETVVVQGSNLDNSTQSGNSISTEEIVKKGDGNLGSLLQKLTGVSSLNTGAGISKPIIHGLFGNRITILNNGIPQGGQQWGNDHAPEIDPFVASQLSVIKGVGGLAYGGGTLGGIVIVEPGSIDEEPHLHGQLNYLYASNGRGHTLNTQLEQASPWAKWRLTATLRQQGDNHTPDYFLRNTGRREANAALQINKTFGQWKSDLYYSYFSTQIGVLRGSHIGNLTDLNQAISRDVPFFTQANFTYNINAPKQDVQHHLLKIQSSRIFRETQSLQFTYALQLNKRQEFDVRRGGRSDRPALSLKQWSHRLAGHYSLPLSSFHRLKTGIQLDITDNNNDSDTGILPLIPNYLSITPAWYAIVQKERNHWMTEGGIRYEYVALDARTISTDLPRRFIAQSRRFHNLSASLGAKYQASKQLRYTANLGLARRSPAVNELYSFGLHQGVSGIEEGESSLAPENAIKGTLGVDWSSNNRRFFLQALAYYQYIHNYIYLQPLPDFRLTIRGAFPVFQYQQTWAAIGGLDLLFSVEPSEAFKVVTKYSYLHGSDLENALPLVFMPPNRLSSSFELSLPDGKRLSGNTLALEASYTARQKRWEAEQDLLAPPKAYFLLEASAGTHFKLGKSLFHLSLRIDNVLNVRYRDYLNRLRYYADELGRNVVLGVNWDF